MFTHLLFLVFALLICDVSYEISPALLFSKSMTIAMILFSYLLLLMLIYFQNRYLKKSPWLAFFAQIELLVYLFFICHVLNIEKIFISFFPIVFKGLILCLYFFGLGFHYYLYSNRTSPSKMHFALCQIRFLVPFALPFFIIGFVIDLFSFLFKGHQFFNLSNQTPIFYLNSFSLLLLFLFFFPFLIQFIWGCKPLQDSELKKNLENICLKANFKHGGLKNWPVFPHQLTAAIIGAFYPFRYILFTDELLKNFKTEEISAILAHEIGHHYHKHLLIYPCVFMGLAFCCGILINLLGPFLWLFFENYSSFPNLLFYFISFSALTTLIALYFRFIFGFFSRMFERQADLHIFSLGMEPNWLIEALDHIAFATGRTHKQPNWHHGSIEERITFIQLAIKNPSIIVNHHQKTKKFILTYFCLLVITCGLFFITS